MSASLRVSILLRTRGRNVPWKRDALRDDASKYIYARWRFAGFFAVIDSREEADGMNKGMAYRYIPAADRLIIPSEIHSLRQIINRQYDNI